MSAAVAGVVFLGLLGLAALLFLVAQIAGLVGDRRYVKRESEFRRELIEAIREAGRS